MNKFEKFVQILLWLLVIILGISVGAGIYESRVEIPQWLKYTNETGYSWDAGAARLANSGLRFWAYVSTGPLTLLTLISLVVVWRTKGEIRKWWLIALAGLLVDRGMTFSYFIPTMIRLMSETIPEPDAVSVATQWKNLNYVRHLASIVALLAILKTFSVFYKQQGQSN